MKKLLAIGIIALLFAAPLAHVLAESENEPLSQEDWNQQVDQWQGHMKTMQQQMDRIHQTSDPKERQHLLEEHWKTMDEQMQGMRMMGDDMMGHMYGGRGAHMMDDEQQGMVMRDRMDMMQMMMDQMM